MDWSRETLEVQRPASRRLQQQSRQEIMRLGAGGMGRKNQIKEVFLRGSQQGLGNQFDEEWEREMGFNNAKV